MGGNANQRDGTNLIFNSVVFCSFVCVRGVAPCSRFACGNHSCKRGIDVYGQRVRQGRRDGVDKVGETVRIPRDPLLVVDDGVVIDENLERVSVVADRNARLLTFKCLPKGPSLIVTPVAAGGFAGEHERVLSAPDGDVEKEVVPTHNVDVGVIVPGWGWGWVKVKGGGPEDDDSALLELALELYRLANVDEMKAHFWSLKLG